MLTVPFDGGGRVCTLYTLVLSTVPRKDCLDQIYTDDFLVRSTSSYFEIEKLVWLFTMRSRVNDRKIFLSVWQEVASTQKGTTRTPRGPWHFLIVVAVVVDSRLVCVCIDCFLWFLGWWAFFSRRKTLNSTLYLFVYIVDYTHNVQIVKTFQEKTNTGRGNQLAAVNSVKQQQQQQ